MEKDSKKINLPYEFIKKDEYTKGKPTLKYVREHFVYEDFDSAHPTSRIVLNQLYTVQSNIDGFGLPTDLKINRIEATGKSEHYFIDGFGLPLEYISNVVNVSLMRKKGDWTDSELTRNLFNYLNKYEIEESSEGYYATKFDLKKVTKLLKDRNFCWVDCNSDFPLNIRIPLDDKVFDYLVSHIQNKNNPQLTFEISFLNCYALKDFVANHPQSKKYRYFLEGENESNVSYRGLVSYLQIYLNNSNRLKIDNRRFEKIYLDNTYNKNLQLDRIEDNEDKFDKIVFHLSELQKKLSSISSFVNVGLIIIIFILIFK